MSSDVAQLGLPKTTGNLRARADLQIVPQRFAHRKYWAVKDPIALQYFHLSEPEHALVEMLDGQTSLAEVCKQLQEQFAPRTFTLAQVQAIVSRLHEAGILVTEGRTSAPLVYQRQRKKRRWELFSSLTNLLAIRFRGLDPQPLLPRIEAVCRPIFSASLALFCGLILIASLLLLAIRWEQLVARLPTMHEFLGFQNVLLLIATIVCIKILHELGHAVACQHYGARCTEIGLLLLVGMPCLYCDVSDAWLLRSKWQRIAISAAGICVELMLAATATIVWCLTVPGVLNGLALNVMVVCSISTLLLNGNPLLRYDGYYILSDLVEVPNLAERSHQILTRTLSRICLGLKYESAEVFSSRKKRWLATYAICSFVYRAFLIGLILWFLQVFSATYRITPLAHLATGIVLVSLVTIPLIRFSRFWESPIARGQVRTGRAAVVLLLAVATVAGLLIIPFPYHVRGPLVLQPVDAEPVYVTVPGELLRRISVGEKVQPGEILAELESLPLEEELAQLTTEYNLQQVHVQNLQSQSLINPQAEAQLPAARVALDDLQQRLDERKQQQQRLTLRAPIAGTVLPAKHKPHPGKQASDSELPTWSGSPLDKQNIGSLLTTGTLLCQIGDPARLEAVVAIEQGDLEFVREGQQVEILLEQTPGKTIRGKVVEISQLDLEKAPDVLLRSGDLLTGRDREGNVQLLETRYQIRVAIPRQQSDLLLDARGQAKIVAQPRTLGSRLVRYLRRTFTIQQ